MSAAGNARAYLLDTNVWLDYFFPDRPLHESSFAFVDFALSHNAKLLYAVMSLKDVFFLSERKMKYDMRKEKEALSRDDGLAATEFAWSLIACVAENATAVGADFSDVWYAQKQRALHNDFEDNMIMAAAERARVAFLVTNDEALIRHATVPTLTPEDALVHLRATLG